MTGPASASVPGWSAAELATLAQLAETFVRGGSGPAGGARGRRRSDEPPIPAQVRQLRLVLRLIESRPVNLAPRTAGP